MMNLATSAKLQLSFSNIRKSIDTMQNKILKSISASAKARQDAQRKYNKEYFTEQATEINEHFTEDILKCKEETRATVDGEFATIRTTLLDWMMMPPASDCLEMMKSYRDYGITPSLLEIQLFADMAKGNYTALRLIDGLANKSGLHDETFRPIENYLRDLDEAQAEARNAIDNYNGVMGDDYKYSADLQGLEIVVNRHFAPIAEKFNDDAENRFAILERSLVELTDSRFGLTTSKRMEIEKLLNDFPSDEEKIDFVAEIVRSGNTALCDSLRLYDPKLYELAVKAVSDGALENAKRSLEAMQKSDAATKSALEALERADSFRSSGSASI